MKKAQILFIFLIFISPIAFAQTTGEFAYRTSDGKTIPVHYVLPPNINNETRVMFVLHGAERGVYTHTSRILSLVANVAVILPVFSEENFPGYNRINFTTASRPPGEWYIHHIDGIFEQFIAQHRLSAGTYIMYGHSAGGGFTVTSAMVGSSPYMEYGIASGAGPDRLFDENVNFPFGIRNVLQYKDIMLRNFSKKLYLLIGSEDDERYPENRLTRNRSFYESGRNYARQNNVNFNWELIEIPGGGHSVNPTIPYVLDILTGNNYYFRNNAAISTRSFNQLSGQQRIHGTWASVNNSLSVNNVVVFSGDKMIWYSGSNLRVIRIDSFTAIDNTGTNTSDRFPNGYRIRGVYTEGDRAGEAYNLPWYISTDNRSLIQGSAGTVIYNRYR